MGQRHQIYLRLPGKFYFEGNPNNRPAITVGIHHQWLYGQTAIKQLERALIFFRARKADDFGDFFNPAEAAQALAAVYSCIPEEGYFHRLHILRDGPDDSLSSIGGKAGWDSCCEAPEEGDNNDGITVIDFEGPTVKYCFASLHHLEGKKSYPGGSILSALSYLLAYYPNFFSDSGEDVAPKDMQLDFAEKIAVTKQFDLLTATDLHRIFPKSKLRWNESPIAEVEL